MDIRNYFQKLREVERSMESAWVTVVSLETPDGGKPGIVNELSRENAAQLIVEGRARMATEAEATEYRESMTRQREKAQGELAANRVQFTLLSEENMRSLRSTMRPGRG